MIPKQISFDDAVAWSDIRVPDVRPLQQRMPRERWSDRSEVHVPFGLRHLANPLDRPGCKLFTVRHDVGRLGGRPHHRLPNGIRLREPALHPYRLPLSRLGGTTGAPGDSIAAERLVRPSASLRG